MRPCLVEYASPCAVLHIRNLYRRKELYIRVRTLLCRLRTVLDLLIRTRIEHLD